MVKPCKLSHQNQWFPQEPRDALTAAVHPIEGPRSAAEAQDLQGLGDPASVFAKKTRRKRGSWAILMWKYGEKNQKWMKHVENLDDFRVNGWKLWFVDRFDPVHGAAAMAFNDL